MTNEALAAGVRWLRDMADKGSTPLGPLPSVLIALADAVDRDAAARAQLANDGPPIVYHLGRRRQMMMPELSDEEVAGEARMLTHSELTPERLLAGGKPLDYYCVQVRDRIMSLSQRLDAMAHKTAWPEQLPNSLAEILHTMLWVSGRLCAGYRAAGFQIKTRAEDEQAFILHRLIGFWFKHGDDWRKFAADDLRQIIDAAKAKQKAAG